MSEKQLSKKQKRLSNKNGQQKRETPQGNFLQLREISPLTYNQRRTFESFAEGRHLFVHGTAGTGKTFVSLYLALKAIENRDYDKVYIFRSAVPTRDMGFMPGTAKEKAKMYEAPYGAICSELYGRGDAYQILAQKDIVQFEVTSYIRGITLDNCVVIVDESQNMSAHELDSIITRLGENCRIIYCGDSAQSDFVKESDKSGFAQFARVITKMNSFETIIFDRDDIVRGPTVKEYIIAKENLQASF